MKRYTEIRSQVRLHTANFTARSGIAKSISVVVPVAVGLLLTVATFSRTSASIPTGPASQAEATVTITVTSALSITVPSPISSSEPSPADSSQAPTAQNTAEGAVATNPVPEETRQAQVDEATAAASRPTATANTSILPSDATPGTNNSPGTTPPGSTAASTNFPWLPVILLGAAILGGLFYLMSRRRTPNVVTLPTDTEMATSATPYQATEGSTNTSTVATSSTTTSTTVAQPVAPTVVASMASAPPPLFVPPVDMPSTLDCPNCGTSNGINENFCHDCGQDLRPTRAALLEAIAPPPDLVNETTPYLETVSRVDEQLEYVLARSRVIIGTAAGSDIVIDSLFKGWQTIDPTHAELRRENEGFVLVDRGSNSGTFVNEMRTGENMLSDGDVIRVGDVRFIFRVPA